MYRNTEGVHGQRKFGNPCIAGFVCNHQVKKALISVKRNIFIQCCTLTPVWISNTEGCLRSGKFSHAVWCTAKV